MIRTLPQRSGSSAGHVMPVRGMCELVKIAVRGSTFPFLRESSDEIYDDLKYVSG